MFSRRRLGGIVLGMLLISLYCLLLANPAKADSCQDIILPRYQSAIDAQTLATSNELGRRGISNDSSIYQQQMETALAPLKSKVDSEVNQCRLSEAKLAADNAAAQATMAAPQATWTPSPTRPAPTPLTQQVVQVIITATPSPTQPPVKTVSAPTTPVTRRSDKTTAPSPTPTFIPTWTPAPTISPNQQILAAKTHKSLTFFQKIKLFFLNLLN